VRENGNTSQPTVTIAISKEQQENHGVFHPLEGSPAVQHAERQRYGEREPRRVGKWGTAALPAREWRANGTLVPLTVWNSAARLRSLFERDAAVDG
jgi:hypothetical protein